MNLMATFAKRTGLCGPRPQRRYLWTDAFAVCNFLGLGKTDLALRLVDDVHHVLGRRNGNWISGLSGLEGEQHPTIGGLRIGKRLPERPADEPLDHELEWERDGQYFHYLTKWMHALLQLARTTGRDSSVVWARELADTAHRKFVDRGHIHWKMSVDLSRPQVASMGHHDPLDGYVTALELEVLAPNVGPSLERALADYRDMLEPGKLATDDALGIGGLFVDAHRLAHIDREPALQHALLEAARVGLDAFLDTAQLRLPAGHRFAFRELGLAIGLAASGAKGDVALYKAITSFWLHHDHRGSQTYRDHADINDVMLATALEPRGFLDLA